VARYFVTGATGFIGGEVVKQLVGRGHRVVALVRTLDGTALLQTLGVDLHVGDITYRASLGPPMNGVDGVFHIAGWYKIGPRNPLAERVNVEGTRNVLETMRERGVAKGLYASSVAVLGDTGGAVVDETFPSRGPGLTHYDRTKWKAHYEVAVPMIAQGLPLVIAMPGLVYGPGDTSGVRSMILRVLQGRMPIVPSGASFSWGYIEDVARGLVLAMESGRIGESYCLTGPPHRLDDALTIVARLSNRKPPTFLAGPAIMRGATAVTAFLERLGLPSPYPSEGLRLLTGTSWTASSEKAQRELGFTARPLEEGLTQTIEYELRRMGKT
jgi:nucleoside-diphosphate-sugar epimerase